MKIAHINNPSGIATNLAAEQRRKGHDVDIFVFNQIIFKQFGGTRLRYWSPLDRWSLFKKLKRYDVWHYHYPYGSLKKSLEIRNADKIYLKHYHGNDLRGRHEEGFCLVSTPDLLKNAPRGEWLPTPIDLNEVTTITSNLSSNCTEKVEDHEPPWVAHYPYYKNYQASDQYSEVLSRLHKEGRCVLVNILNQPHSEALRMVATCDIVIGKIIPEIGWFGKFELEGMALGRSVIAYVSEELYEKYRPPVYRTTVSTFQRDLEGLLDNPSRRQLLSKDGMEYVRKNHSLELVVQALMTYYHKMSPDSHSISGS
jgi:glycosyltransferase involved in cell wall biosynthesis